MSGHSCILGVPRLCQECARHYNGAPGLMIELFKMTYDSDAGGQSSGARMLDEGRIRCVSEAACAAMLDMGVRADVAELEIAAYEAEQRYETSPPPAGPRMLGREMNKRLANPDWDRFLGRPENADDMEDEFGRGLLL